jgi:hypothetical protein
MFLASVCAIVMFMLPLFGWRAVNTVLCGVKLRQISASRMCPLLCASALGTLLPLVAVVVFVGGVTAACGLVAWLAGFVFWFFNH